jgi:hypothetical protein
MDDRTLTAIAQTRKYPLALRRFVLLTNVRGGAKAETRSVDLSLERRTKHKFYNMIIYDTNKQAGNK